MTDEQREETYALPDDKNAATAYVNSLQRKGYRVKKLSTTHVVVLVPSGMPPQENVPPKKQLLQD